MSIIDNAMYRLGYTKETPRDRRLSYIEIPCGECKECKKKRKEMWRLRIENELLDSKSAIFFTGTFSDEAIENIKKQYGVKEENDIATKANRLFLERLRKKYSTKNSTSNKRGGRSSKETNRVKNRTNKQRLQAAKS